jgi:hypothetical protein
MALFQLKLGGSKTVTTAGTRVQLSSTPTIVYGLSIQAKAANSGNIYVGDSTVSSSNGHILDAGVELELVPPQIRGIDGEMLLSDVYLDADTNGDGVIFSYWIKS